ncbi:MAG: hypothetical protein J0J01_09360 [Reyranella sp.]|uniref:hypothetical protein n=1 Tax=Reyranella sp. TaxID=1929291 RepID=UPI001AC2EAB9|nr:hypothetical protein [Reyranella sp.]MBN9087103.1 hypothetical protein [Reyranella sp.]
MIRRVICVALCLLSAACASAQLNHNTTDLASSLSSLAKTQILYNLAQAITDPEFVPSQVTISVGTAQTANSVSPSVSVPLGPSFAVANRITTGGRGGNQLSNISTNAAPGLGIQVTDAWNQSWTMVPANSANQLRRLRTLYQFATGTLARRDPTKDLTEKEAERQFLCDYAMQSLAVHPESAGGNVRYRVDDCLDSSGALTSRLFYADPSFTQGPSCVVCIGDLHEKSARPHLNPALKYHFIRTNTQKTDDMVRLGSHGGTEFYVCGSAAGACGFVPGQRPFDGRRAFSDFVLFVHEAMSQPGGGTTGSPRQSSGAAFVYAVR